MNKKQLLLTIIFSGAIAGIFAWAFYSGAFLELPMPTNSSMNYDSKSQNTTSEFAPLTKTSTTPAEVNDTSLKELDNYMKTVDSTEFEDLSDLE